MCIEPCRSCENPFVESFNGTFRSGYLKRGMFANGHEAQMVMEVWRQEYNQQRPDSSLGYLALAAFAEQARLSTHSD